MANKHKSKTKRLQPRPKVKKQKVKAKDRIGAENPYLMKLKKMGRMFEEILKDKEELQKRVNLSINWIENCFKRYDTIQLLGGVGLYLLDNLQNFEKIFLAQMEGKKLELDEHAEVIAEYAMNFGLAMPNDGKEQPTDEIVRCLIETLRMLAQIYGLMDMPLSADDNAMVEWALRMDTINVRGDGYQVHVMDLFNGMFEPHSDFYKERYGFSFGEMRDFFEDLENRTICKIGSQDMVYGATKMWDRWRKWEDNHKRPEDDWKHADLSKGIFSDFFEANPDVPRTPDGQKFLCYQPDDFTGAEKIFWVYPQNEVEKNILETLSQPFGSNAKFLQGEHRGNVMNGYDIFNHPFIKDGDKYYCFTPMIVHRNLFLIAESLMKRDDTYYQKHFQQNTLPESRDQYVERKVKMVLADFLPTVTFYSSVPYIITEDGVQKKTELDILGISHKATYLIEVKAHELSYRDRVGVLGAKKKFEDSVGVGCYQCWRAGNYIATEENPKFGKVEVDKTKPVYKIVVTLQQYSALLGKCEHLIKAGWLDEKYKDTWMVCLLDLMVFDDFIVSEDQFIEYLEMHKLMYSNKCSYHDEIDVLSHFLNYNLAEKVRTSKNLMIIDGSADIDAEYAKDFQLPLEYGSCAKLPKK